MKESPNCKIEETTVDPKPRIPLKMRTIRHTVFRKSQHTLQPQAAYNQLPN